MKKQSERYHEQAWPKVGENRPRAERASAVQKQIRSQENKQCPQNRSDLHVTSP
ncbi:hypothetical protein D3C86_2211210 [compost metagenome]